MSAPLDLHDLSQSLHAAGYNNALTLNPMQVQNMAASLRGIGAITAVLIAGNDTDELKLGEWMRGGLIDAIDQLAFCIAADLEQANDRANTAQQEGGRA